MFDFEMVPIFLRFCTETYLSKLFHVIIIIILHKIFNKFEHIDMVVGIKYLYFLKAEPYTKTMLSVDHDIVKYLTLTLL